MCECTHEDKTLDLGVGFRIGVGRLEEGKVGGMEGWSVGCLKWDLRDWKMGGLEGGTVGCLKQDLQDFRIGRIGDGSPVRFETALTGLGDHLSVFPFQTGSIRR